MAWPVCAAVRRARAAAPAAPQCPVQQEGKDDAGGWLTSRSPHPVQGLQIELTCDHLGGNELHGRPLHGIGDCFRITKIVIQSFV